MHDDSTTPLSAVEIFLEQIAKGSIAITPDGQVVRLIDRRSGEKYDVPPRIDHITKRGYRIVSHRFRFRGKTISITAHRLVYHYFYGPIPDGLEINHINGIKGDNRPENIEVVTPVENMRHAFRTGLKVALSGERHWSARLSNADAVEIRRMYATGAWTQRALAVRYGVTRASIGYIVRGQTWVGQAGPTSLDNVRRKLDDKQRREVFELWKTGALTQKQIGERFGVSQQTINDIIRGRRRIKGVI